MAKQKRRRRLRVGRLLALLLAAVLSIGVFAVFVSGMIHIVQEIISPQETPAVQSEPTPTPDPTYRHSYDWQNLKEDEAGFLSYEDSAYRTRLGIDVSHYQGTIDWHAVHDAGVEFAFTVRGTAVIRPGNCMKIPGIGKIFRVRWMRTSRSRSIFSRRQTARKKRLKKPTMSWS